MNLKKSLFCLATVLSSLIFYTASFAGTVTFNANQTSPTPNTFTGFGAMVWTGSSYAEMQALYDLPNFRYARINHEIRNVTVPNNGTLAQYQALWASNGDGATNLARPDVEFIYLASVPSSFMTQSSPGSYKLISGVNLQSLAYYIAAGVQHFNSKYGQYNAQANFVELSNEPDGTWTVYISPSQYNSLVKLVRTQLNSLAPTTKIAGPGVAHIDWSAGTDSWVSSLDSTAISNLGAWSVHDYIWSKNSSGTLYENIDAGTSINGYGQTGPRYFFPRWYKTPKSKAATKPVIVTEFNTNATKFHGITYPIQDQSKLCQDTINFSDCTIAYTVPYGVRVYAHAISLLAGGANAALYWQAADQSWDTSPGGGMGLLTKRPTSSKKTVYYALEPLFKYIPVNSKVLTSTSTQNGNDIYSVAFRSNNASGAVDCITVAMANGTASSNLSRTTTITGITGRTLDTARTIQPQVFRKMTGGSIYQSETVQDPNTTTYSYNSSTGVFTHTSTLAPDTTVTFQACFI